MISVVFKVLLLTQHLAIIRTLLILLIIYLIHILLFHRRDMSWLEGVEAEAGVGTPSGLPGVLGDVNTTVGGIDDGAGGGI